MKKRKILATSGMVTTLLFVGATQSFAQTIQPAHTTSESNTTEVSYEPNGTPDMTDFGITADDQINNAELEQTSEQILIDEGFSASQIHKIFKYSKRAQEY